MYNKVLDIGLLPNANLLREMRYVRLTNIVNLVLIFLSIHAVLFIELFTDGGFKSYLRFYILIFFALVNIVLNYYRQYLLSKVSTALMPFFCIFVCPVLNGFIHQGMFLWFPYGILIVGANSFIIFSMESRREKLTMDFLLIFYIIATIWFDRIMLYYAEGVIDVSFITDNYMYYQISKVFLVASLYSSFYVFKKEYYKSQLEVTILNKKLDDKNSELQALNYILETKVNERTEKLELQNKRIKAFAYLNSHGIRAIVARIIGLTSLLKLNNTKEEQEFYQAEIINNSSELDKLTGELSQDLIEEDCQNN